MEFRTKQISPRAEQMGFVDADRIDAFLVILVVQELSVARCSQLLGSEQQCRNVRYSELPQVATPFARRFLESVWPDFS